MFILGGGKEMINVAFTKEVCMDNDIFSGIIVFTKKEIEQRMYSEGKKIIGEVVTDVMSRLKFEIINKLGSYTTEIVFRFEEKE